jgi:hypothetical protein
MRKWRSAAKSRISVSAVNLLAKAATSGEGGQPRGTLEVRVCEVEEARKGCIKLLEERTLVLPKQPTLGDARESVCELYGWDDCIVLDVSTHNSQSAPIDSDEQLVRPRPRPFSHAERARRAQPGRVHAAPLRARVSCAVCRRRLLVFLLLRRWCAAALCGRVDGTGGGAAA